MIVIKKPPEQEVNFFWTINYFNYKTNNFNQANDSWTF